MKTDHVLFASTLLNWLKLHCEGSQISSNMFQEDKEYDKIVNDKDNKFDQLDLKSSSTECNTTLYF